MKTLRTVYPYGLNDRMSDDYMADQSKDKIGLKFPPLKRTFSRVGRGTKRKGAPSLNHQSFMDQLDSILNTNIKEAANFIRMSLSTMKKSQLKQLGDKINDLLLSNPLDFPYEQWYSMALDTIDCRTFIQAPTKPKRPPLLNVLHVKFRNKGVEMVNISSILRDSEVLQTVPSIAHSFTPPTVVFSLNSPISSKIFNFNKFVTSLNVEQFINDPSILPCNCKDSSFADSHHGHIISGDLRLVEDNKLRKLFTKGPKYRERKLVDWDVIENDLLSSVSECAKAWCDKNKKNQTVLKQWVTTVSSKIKSRIKSLKTSFNSDFIQEVLRNPGCEKSLEELHRKFVIVPIDKASGNVGFVCKRFYAEVLLKELGLKESSGSATYQRVAENITDLVDKDYNTLTNSILKYQKIAKSSPTYIGYPNYIKIQ